MNHFNRCMLTKILITTNLQAYAIMAVMVWLLAKSVIMLMSIDLMTVLLWLWIVWLFCGKIIPIHCIYFDCHRVHSFLFSSRNGSLFAKCVHISRLVHCLSVLYIFVHWVQHNHWFWQESYHDHHYGLMAVMPANWLPYLTKFVKEILLRKPLIKALKFTFSKGMTKLIFSSAESHCDSQRLCYTQLLCRPSASLSL